MVASRLAPPPYGHCHRGFPFPTAVAHHPATETLNPLTYTSRTAAVTGRRGEVGGRARVDGDVEQGRVGLLDEPDRGHVVIAIGPVDAQHDLKEVAGVERDDGVGVEVPLPHRHPLPRGHP